MHRVLLFLIGLVFAAGFHAPASAQQYEVSASYDRVLQPFAPLGDAAVAAFGENATEREVFRSISEEIGVNLYPGLQRGHEGVVHALSGNSLEQSLLLANLLAQRGYETRLAQVQLNDEQALRLVVAQRNYFEAARRLLKDPKQELLKLATQVSYPSPDDLRAVAELYVLIESRYAKLLSRSESQLRAVIEPDQSVVQLNAAEQAGRFLQFARDHYWVQLKQDDAWVDLDPTFALPWGEAIAIPDATLSAAEAAAKNTYWVTIAVEATYQIPGNGRRTRRHLEVRAPADALAAHPLFLLHPAHDEPLFLGMDLGGLNRVGWGGIDYYPMLIGLGGVFEGTLLKYESWEGLGGLLGGARPSFLSEELVVTIQRPDGMAQEYRRFTIDLVRAGERPKEGDWAFDDFVLPEGGSEDDPLASIPAPLRSIYALGLRTYPTLVNDYVPFGLAGSPEVEDSGYYEVLLALGGLIDEFHRFDEVQRARHDRGRFMATPTEPNLTLLTLRGVGDDDSFRGVYGLDLLHSDLALIAGGDLFRNSLLKLVHEQSYIELISGKFDDSEPVFSALSLLSAAEEQHIDLVSLAMGELAELHGWSESDRALVGLLSADERLVAPVSPVVFQGRQALAWFIVDLRTGAFQDGTSLGARAAITEYLQNTRGVTKAARALCKLKQCIELAYNAANTIVTILRGKVNVELAKSLNVKNIKQARDRLADCSKVRVRMQLYKRWGKKPPATNKDRDAQDKIEAMQDAAKGGKLTTPDNDTYDKLRNKDPSEFAGGRGKRSDQQWDHRLELGCGGSHSKDNVFALDQGVNGSLGNFFGAACRRLCEGTTITEIIIEYVLPGGPGLGSRAGK